jgi:hypothetical protein
MKPRKTILWLILVIGIAGCGSQSAVPAFTSQPTRGIKTVKPNFTLVPEVTPLTTKAVETMKANTPNPPEFDPLLKKFVEQAKADLARRLGIPAEQIELVSIKSVVWPDGSLGCPKPGMLYIQVQKEGLLIRLRVGEKIYSYHSGEGHPPFLCEDSASNRQP